MIIDAEGTYYVWVIDAQGNINDTTSISAYTISLEQGIGTLLTAMYDSDSILTWTEFNGSMIMLAGTSVWSKAELQAGYNTLVHKLKTKKKKMPH